MKTILFLGAFLFSTTLFAGRIRDIDFVVDSTNFCKTNTFSITVFLIKKNGKRITLTPNELSIHWNKIKVTGQHLISFNRGIVKFDQQAVTTGNNSANLEITYNNLSMQLPITFPYVTGLILKNNTIAVNHPMTLDYELIFNNGKTALPSPTLFNENNFVNSSVSEVNLVRSSFLIRLDEPAAYETVELLIKNRLNNQELGKKIMSLEYPTTCKIDGSGNSGANGINGANGKKTSESGSNGTNGSNGQTGVSVRVFTTTKIFNQTKFVIIHAFYSDNRHQTEVLKFDGQPIVISTNGGNGGSGGNGGIGSNGSINIATKVNSPMGGHGGSGGTAGSGGNAGNISLIFTPEITNSSTIFSTSSNGGFAGAIGVGGKGGKGDYSDVKFIGKVLNTRDGNNGNNGLSGQNGLNALTPNFKTLTIEEWKAFYTRHINEGFIF